MDFTIKTYHQLLDSLVGAGYTFQTYREYVEKLEIRKQKTEVRDKKLEKREVRNDGNSKNGALNIEQGTLNKEHQIIILRHDVDKLPQNALRFAQIQAEKGIKGTYYFRMHKHSYHEEVIKKITDLGHEIGYHYETMESVVSGSGFKIPGIKVKCRKFAGESPDEILSKHTNAAYEAFCTNLEKFRKIADIKTISMHGSYSSKYDNKTIWDKYDYKKLGILGEPYMDLNFDEFFYLTDTGRRWDGWNYSILDKVQQQKDWIKQGLIFKTTQEIIHSANQGKLPNKIMFTFHPQRWSSNPYQWTKELVLQNAKNQVKRFLVKK